ncbi:type II toxin-antitoxin system RelE/ParE family toxin [Streptomyces sp. DH17]|nr:type II toxin-antitoxin system RelE/ParE family toxin [Streptomyces sp. DH17]
MSSGEGALLRAAVRGGPRRLLGGARFPTLGEPYSRHLGGKLRELRFELDGEAVRIPYWLAPGQRIVLLTVFRKTRMREAAEVERAHQAQKVCEAEHARAWGRRRLVRRSRGGAAVCRRPASLM